MFNDKSKRNLLIGLGVLVAVLAVVWLYFFSALFDQEYDVENMVNIEVKTFSLTGEVKEIRNNSLIFSVGWVEKIDGLNKVVNHDKEVLFTNDTQLFLASGDRQEGTFPGLSSRLKVGDTVTVVGPGNPYSTAPVTALEIHIK